MEIMQEAAIEAAAVAGPSEEAPPPASPLVTALAPRLEDAAPAPPTENAVPARLEDAGSALPSEGSSPVPALQEEPPSVASQEQRELDDLEMLLCSGPPSARRAAPPATSSSSSAAGAGLPLGPPTRAEIMVMPVQQAVRTLEQYVTEERVVDAVCDRWRALSYGPARRQSAADAGALHAIVAAMRALVDSSAAQETCCLAIGNIVAGVDEAGVARKHRAAEAGCLEALSNAMQAHLEASAVQEYGCFALGNICYAADSAGLGRKQRAADACAVSAIVRAMRKHSGDAAVAEYGAFALGNICRAVGGRESGTDEDGRARKESAVDAGALGVLVNAMRFHAKESGVQEWGARALSNITFGNAEWRESARQAGARPQWLVGMAEAMEEIQKSRDLHGSASKTERLAIRAPQPRASNTARPASRAAPGASAPLKRQPRVAPPSSNGVGKMVPLPAAGPLWR